MISLISNPVTSYRDEPVWLNYAKVSEFTQHHFLYLNKIDCKPLIRIQIGMLTMATPYLNNLYFREDFQNLESFIYFFIDDSDFTFLIQHGSKTFLFRSIDQLYDFGELIAIRLDQGCLNGDTYLCEITESFFCPYSHHSDCNDRDEMNFVQLTIRLIGKIDTDIFTAENAESRANEIQHIPSNGAG